MEYPGDCKGKQTIRKYYYELFEKLSPIQCKYGVHIHLYGRGGDAQFLQDKKWNQLTAEKRHQPRLEAVKRGIPMFPSTCHSFEETVKEALLRKMNIASIFADYCGSLRNKENLKTLANIHSWVYDLDIPVLFTYFRGREPGWEPKDRLETLEKTVGRPKLIIEYTGSNSSPMATAMWWKKLSVLSGIYWHVDHSSLKPGPKNG